MALHDPASASLLGILSSPLVAALNRLLNEERWARERLAPFAGEVLELAAGPLPGLRLRILEDGSLYTAAADEPPAVRIALGPASLAALAAGRGAAAAFSVTARIPGKQALAAELQFLSRHLRWDAEETLSRFIGDVPARRALGAARELAAWPRDAARRLAENLAEYALDERGLLLKRAPLQAFAAELADLQDALARLEDRVSRLR